MINTLYFTNTEIVITQGTYSKKKPKIKKRIVLDMPEDAIKNGELLDITKLAHLVSAALKKNKMKANSVILMTQHADINVVPIQIPYVKGRLDQAINMKLSESYLGVSENNYIDYKISKIDKNICYGVAIISPKAILNSYYKLSVKIGCGLKSIDYIGNVLFKNLALDDRNLLKKTILITDVTDNNIQVHLINNGQLVMSRNEFGSNISFGQEEAREADFVFDPRVKIVDEDENAVQNAYMDIQSGIEDLISFNTAQATLFKRFAKSSDKPEEYLINLESTINEIADNLVDLCSMCKIPLNLDEIEKTIVKFNEIKDNVDHIENSFMTTEKMNQSFYGEIVEIINLCDVEIKSVLEILDKYIVKKVDKDKEIREQLLNRACKQIANLMYVADLSGDFPDVEKLYFHGMQLNAKEKKLVENNMLNNNAIEVSNYSTYSHDEDPISSGLLYNEYRYFRDLDIGRQIEKNDKANRGNLDNVVFGIGGIMIFGVITLTGLAGFNKYQIYSMNQKIKENEVYMEKNKNISTIIAKLDSLSAALVEVKNYEEYFSVVNYDLNDVKNELDTLAKDVEIKDIGIDASFLVTCRVTSTKLEYISRYLEDLNKADFQNVVVIGTEVTESGFSITFTFNYEGVTKEEEK